MNLFYGGIFWKAPLCLEASRRGFFSDKLTFLDFLDVPIFWKSVFSLDFVIFILKMVPQAKPLYPSEAKAFPAAYGG